MKGSEHEDLSERKGKENSKEKEDSESEEDSESKEDLGFWSMICGKEAYFLPKDGGAKVLSISDYTAYQSGTSLYNLSLVNKILMAASGEVNLEISKELIGLSEEESESSGE